MIIIVGVIVVAVIVAVVLLWVDQYFLVGYQYNIKMNFFYEHSLS